MPHSRVWWRHGRIAALLFAALAGWLRPAGGSASACLGDDDSELVYAADGSVTGIRHHWAFDDMFSAFATQGMQSKVKGQFSREELAPLAQTNIELLKEYKYFNYATADGKKAPFADPLPGYWLDYKNAILILNFTLPFSHPVKAKQLRVEIYDPTIFVDFEFAKRQPVNSTARRPAASSTSSCRRTSPPRNRRSSARLSSIRSPRRRIGARNSPTRSW